MLKRCIAAENRKLHRSPIWLMFFVMPLISASYGTFNYLQNLEILHERWYSLWTQHTLFYSMLFFPAMVAAYAAYLWRLEHMGHNWNLIMAAPVPPLDLFLAKFCVVFKLALFTQVWELTLFVACGKLFVSRLAAGGTDFVWAAGHSRGAGGDCSAIAAGHGPPQLCGADLPCHCRRHRGHAAGQQGVFPLLALLPDAGWHERQPQRGYSRRAGRAVCRRQRLLAGSHVCNGLLAFKRT